MAATPPQNISSASDSVICPVLSAHVPEETLTDPAQLPYSTTSRVAGQPINGLSLAHVSPPVPSAVARVQSAG